MEIEGLRIESPAEIMKFSGRGTIWSFTIIPRADYAPEGFEYLAPYAVALVRLEEGPLVTAMLTDVDLKDIEIDMEVEVVSRFLTEAGDRGLRVYGYKFRPPVPVSTKTMAEVIEEIMNLS
ncbi:OB-fold domain-containing protein [Candidatus Collierbacteria bacterium]|nr:OB-fold domain-containing protein [Candidatus Collierbacteria bacterium]